MHCSDFLRNFLFLTSMTCLSFFLLCSRDNKKIVGPEPDAPIIQLIQPSSGIDTVADSINSYRIRGTITVDNSLSVTAFSINGTSYLDSVSTTPYEFAVTVTLDTDTNRFLLAATDSKSKITADTVTIIREEDIIPLNQAVLTGTMYRPSSSFIAKRLVKTVMAANAAGQTSPVSAVLPLTGADILFYNADSISTSSVVSTKTDSNGIWKVTVTPGNYFIFAVWFDQQNLELITAAIPNVKAEAGKADTTEDKVALVDDIPPMALTFMDAEAADDNNTFLASDLAQGLPIVITFSEPMNRMSVGEDTTGIVLGEIDQNDETVSLKNKIRLGKIWSATGKELRLVPQSPLTIGKYYKVIIPATVKDLALNKLGSAYYGIFSVISRTDLLPFAVKGATIRNGDTISTAKIIEILFSRPIDGISLNKNFSLSPTRNSFFEAKAATARLSFTSDSGLMPNTTYTLQIKRSVRDLLGDSLSTVYSLTFRTSGAIDSASGQGAKAKIVSFVGTTMEALIAQDIERFSQSFHPLLEVTDIVMRDGKEESIKQNLEEFLQARRNDAAIEKKMAIEGVLFPKIYKKTVGTDTLQFKKLIGKSGVGSAPAGRFCYIEDIGPGGFKQPQVLDSTGTSITTQVTFKGDTLVAYGSSFIMNIPFNLAFTTTDVDQRDPSYFGKLQNEKTNIEMDLVTIITKNSYSVRSVDTTRWSATPKSADVLLDLITTEQQSNSTVPFTRVMAIKMTVVEENGRLLVRILVAKQVFEGTNEQFKQNQTTILNNQNFNLDSLKVTETKGIELYSPAQKAVKVAVPVKFSWSKIAGVNGYIIGISNEISGGTSGLLIFTRDTTITIGANGSVTGGAVLTVDPSQIRVPIPRFINRMNGFDSTKVYIWKVIGIADSTSTKITTQLDVLADSDFRPSRQPGFFTLAAVMPDLSNIIINQTDTSNVQPNDFADSDKDGYPDWLETALGTKKLDAASKPEMTIDSDRDGIADFFESMFNTKPEDSASRPADANGNHVPDTLEKMSTWDVRLNKDSDNDTWLDEIEMALRTDPWNASSFPQTFAKGAAPAGNYRGRILIQSDNKEYTIAITIGVDSTGGASAMIDSTTLNILRTGERLACGFEFGEWVFYSKMIAGLNVNKYLKFRAMPKYQELEGNIDMSDQANGGGPLVGRFRVRTDGNVPSLIGGDPNVQPGTINPPPQDFINNLNNPPSDAKTMTLAITKDATSGKYTATLSIDGMPQLTSFEALWQPQMFPRYIFKFAGDSGEIRIEGDVFKDAAAMYLGGPVFINMKQSLDFILRDSLAKLDDPTTGTWKGFAKKSNITDIIDNNGPLAYIGPREALESALTQTSKKAMNILDSSTIVIREFWQEGIWKCKDSTGTSVYQILEKPGDPQNVFVGKDKSGADVIMIRTDGGGPNGPMPFKGPKSEIVNALITSGLSVKVETPNNPTLRDARVDTSTLRKVADPKNPFDSIYQVRDLTDTMKYYLFMGDPAKNGGLMLMDNKPLVSEMGAGPQPQTIMIPYTGPINAIQTALSASANGVTVMMPNNPMPRDAQIDAASLESFTDSLKPGITLYRAHDAQDAMKLYVFMADSASGQLLIQNNKPVVSEMGTGPQKVMVPYTGPINTIQTALTASANGVLVMVPNNPTPRAETVNFGTLQPFTDPQKPGITQYQVQDARNSVMRYVFMADSATGQLMIQNNKPLVAELGAGPQPQNVVVPYSGPITNIQTALATSSNSVKVIVPNDTVPRDAQIDPATLQPFSDPQKPGMTNYQVRDVQDSMKMYFFLADSGTGQLKLRDNKPLVSEMGGQGPMIQPFRGSITLVETVLTASNNQVQLKNPMDGSILTVSIDRATLQSIPDPQASGQTIIVAARTDNATIKVLFTGMPENPAQLNIDPGTNRPVVVDAPPGTI